MLDRPSGKPTARDFAIAGRQLDLVLDQICLASTDVSSFLLDPAYSEMLSEGEKQIANEIRSVLSAAESADSTDCPARQFTARRLRFGQGGSLAGPTVIDPLAYSRRG